ncbi:MAG: hypothetical protein AABY11_01490, partial [archaeon]
IVTPGMEEKIRLFFHSGFGVRTTQGAALRWVFENPADEAFVNITLDSESYGGFWIGPTYPVFDARWVKPVDIRVSLSPDAPSRDITFEIVVVAPPNELREEWINAWGSAYYDATTYVGEKKIARVTLTPE